MDLSQNKQHQIIGNLKINWNHKTIFQTHNFICFPPPKLLFAPCLCNDEGLCPDCTSINSSINRTLNKILPRLRACEQSEFSLAIISRWFIDAKLESGMLWCGFLEAKCIRGCSQRYVTCGKWCLEISEMDLNHCLGALRLKRRQDCGSNKNNSSNQILIGSIRPEGQLSCYYFPGKWPNNLNRCLHPLHPTSRYTAKRINKTNTYPSHLDTKRALWKINVAISIAVLYFVLSHVLEQLSVITRASPGASFGQIWCRTLSTECHSWLRVYNSIAN